MEPGPPMAKAGEQQDSGAEAGFSSHLIAPPLVTKPVQEEAGVGWGAG